VRAQNKIISDAAEIIRANRNKPKPKPKMVVVAPPPPKPKVQEAKDAIMMAASQLKSVTREVGAPAIPEQKELIEIAKAIAAEMEKLSIAAREGNKKEMITAARNIAGLVTKVQEFSGLIANKCLDPKLKEKLLQLSRVPKNFAVQLKIISAVKATSGDNDYAAVAQLVTCAEGVANSVVLTVKAGEAASIKCK